MFKCIQCFSSFQRKDILLRHMKIHKVETQLSCSICSKSFTRRDNLMRHKKKMHGVQSNEGQAVVEVVPVIPDLQIISEEAPAAVPVTAVVTNTLDNLSDSQIEIAPGIFVPNTAAGPAPTSYEALWNANNESEMNLVYDMNNAAGLIPPNPVSRKRVGKTNSAVRCKKLRLSIVNTSGFVEISSAMNRSMIVYYAKNITNLSSYSSFLESVRQSLIEILLQHSNIEPIKFSLTLEGTYKKPLVESSPEDRDFKTAARVVLLDTDINTLVSEAFAFLISEEDTYMGRGSGFSLLHVDGISLSVYRYTPLGGSSYIDVPVDISSKKSIINPQNNNQQCFKWAVIARHVTGTNKNRVGENYSRHEAMYNFTGLSCPTPISEIKIFEKNNAHVSINVFGLKQDKKKKYILFPLKVVVNEKATHIDLLFITDGENNHYTYISNFARLVRAQMTGHKEAIWICKRCFTSFDNRTRMTKLHGLEALNEHKLICDENKPILPIMPAEGAILEFNNWCNTQRHPLVIYADFEALIVECDESKGESTSAFQEHLPMSYGIYVKAIDDYLPKELLQQHDIPMIPIIYRGSETREEVAQHFVKAVTDIARNIEELLKTNIEMPDYEREKHNANGKCNLCKIKFSWINPGVADHCHLTGRFRQSLCNNCNLSLKQPKFVPCFFHNLSNYDAHFIVTELGYDTNTISIIPNSEEKYISFSKFISNRFTIRFIDTCRFMTSKLSTLAKNLITDRFEKFRETAKMFPNNVMNLVTCKGVYPYEYTNSWAKLEDTNLPSKRQFYSTLTEEHITDEEYTHAKEVWRHFDCKTLGDYSDLYLKIDVLLLADVFENFRDICLSTYHVDPAFYFTSPGMSFDCMLKKTGVKLELLTDYNMILFFEKGIRGGLTQASMRYAKTNNSTVADYDDTKPKSWIIYQDCNNLYGWAMSEYMPYSDFKWVEPVLKGLECLDEISPIGRVYEVDIKYPINLHDEHSDLPFLPEKIIPPGSSIKKLMVTLQDKKHYIIHYRNLQQAIENGLIVTKVHKVLQFKQSPWLAEYISMNTEMRKRANNEFEKDFYKLMNNAVFGKTLESVRTRLKMELVCNERRFLKLVNKSTFKNATIYNENLCAVSLENKRIKFCKPIYIGFSVLEISKIKMYDYHYKIIKIHFGSNIFLMYTDTDSLVYFILTDNFYADLLNNPVLLNSMDTSNLPRDHPCYISDRKKIPGFFKDEAEGNTITEFVALRAKSYAFNIKGGKEAGEHIKAKGIRAHVVKHHMTLQDHKRCLFGDTSLVTHRENFSIRSFEHQLKTIKSNKLTFNPRDDKRFILEDGIHTLAHGHYRINELTAD